MSNSRVVHGVAKTAKGRKENAQPSTANSASKSTVRTGPSAGASNGCMSTPSGEYRGPMLKELQGKRVFLCEVDDIEYPITLLDIHHKNPQLAGTDNSRENLAFVATNAHVAIHRIAVSLAGNSKDKKSALELCEEYAEAVNPKNKQKVTHNLLGFVVLVAQAIAQKKNKQIEGGDVDTLLSLPPRLNSLFKGIGRIVKDGEHRPLGKDRLLKLAVCNLISTHFPEVKSEVDQYVFTEVLRNSKEFVPQTKMTDVIQRRRL
jgi:hypothetical protein